MDMLINLSLMNQYTHTQEINKKIIFNFNKDIFKDYKDKILFYPIYNLPTEKDILNICNNNILYENKDLWIYEVYTRDYIQKVIKNDFQFLNP